jgi:Transposase IS4
MYQSGRLTHLFLEAQNLEYKTQKKSVILLSTMYSTGETDSTDKCKPEIITFYNKTKSGVDNLDQMVSNYSCKRATRRWPFAIRFNVMDVAALNAFKIFAMQHPERYRNINHQRKDFLKDLAKELMMPYMTDRATRYYKRLRSQTQDSMKRCGLDLRPALCN